MANDFSARYGDLLTGSYDCVDRIVLIARFFAMLPVAPLDCERRTSYTLAGAFAASTRKTPGPDGGRAVRCSTAIRCLRYPALQ